MKKSGTKLSLGTAQFGLAYGATNLFGRVEHTEVNAMLNLAYSRGIASLDTAAGYGDSEVCLGLQGDIERFSIVTKVLPYRQSVDLEGFSSEAFVTDSVQRSLERLQLDAVYAVLLHTASDLLATSPMSVVRQLEDLKGAGMAEKVGVSVYTEDEVDIVLKYFRPDIIQCPINIFDQRLIHSGCIERLNNLGIHVYARSVFLQGLLLDPTLHAAQNRALELAPLQRWFDLVDQNSVLALKTALQFVTRLDGIQSVVIGATSAGELEAIVDATMSSYSDGLTDIAKEVLCSDLVLLDPRKWPAL